MEIRQAKSQGFPLGLHQVYSHWVRDKTLSEICVSGKKRADAFNSVELNDRIRPVRHFN